MTQTIPNGVWTKLDGYDAEVFQRSGATVSVEVVDGALSPEPPAVLWLRPPGGVWTDGFRVPIAGTWVHGDWAMGGGPVIVMDSGRPITFDTEDASALTAEWRP